MYKLILCLILCFNSFAQESPGLEDFVNIHLDSEESHVESLPDERDKSRNSVSSQSVAKECTEKDQVSMPLKNLQAIMIGPDRSLNAYPSASGDLLNVKANSKIMGNCRSMLSPQLKWNERRQKYLYEVKILKPCQQEKCNYKVTTKSNGAIKSVNDKFYEPNLKGFYQCMQDNVGLKLVEKNGKKIKQWDESRVVKRDLPSPDPVSSLLTAELYFVSSGPLAGQYKGAVNLMPDKNTCDHFEEIEKNGYVHFSKAEKEQARLEKQAQALCKDGKYTDIENSLGLFAHNKGLYQSLMKVRDELLLQEMERYKRIFDNAAKKKNLSSLDSKKYKKLMKDFYNLIVDKNLSDSNHTIEDQRNPDLVVNIIAKLEAAAKDGNDTLVTKLQKDLDKQVEKLAGYLTKPYFSASDFKKFVDLKLKPNFEDDNWTDASETLHKSIVSLKLLCKAYGSGKKCKKNKTKGAVFKEQENTIPSLGSVISKAQNYNDNVREENEKKLELIQTPKAYRSYAYKQRLLYCNQHKQVANQYAQGIQGIRNQISRRCQMESGNSQYRMKLCLEGYVSDIQYDSENLQNKISDCKENEKKYSVDSAKWKALESDRDVYLGLSKKQRAAKQKKAEQEILGEKYEYNFAISRLNSQQQRVPANNPSLSTPTFNPNSQYQSMYRPQYNNQSLFGQNQFGQNQFGQNQFGQNQFGQNQFGQNQFGQNQFGQNQFGQNQFGQNQFTAPFQSQFQFGGQQSNQFTSPFQNQFGAQGNQFQSGGQINNSFFR